MKSVPLEELQVSSSEYPHGVHSPFELQLRSTPHYLLNYRMTRGVPQERHSRRTPLEKLLRNSVGTALKEFCPYSP